MNNKEIVSEARELMRIWDGQISLTRDHLSTAVIALTEEFAGIVDHLNHLLKEMRRLESDAAWQVGADGGNVLEGRLRASARRIDSETSLIRQRMEQALLHLQFQDRVDQILAHLQTGVRLLDAAHAEAAEDVNYTTVLEAMRSMNTTREENELHRHSSGGGRAGETDEPTYF